MGQHSSPQKEAYGTGHHESCEAPDTAKDHDETIVSAIAGHQLSLLSYALALVANHSDAEDLVQRTNTTLWKKRADFVAGTSFRAWAFTIMRFHAKAFYRSQQRRQKVIFNDELTSQLAEAMAQDPLQKPDERLEFLRTCLAKLPQKHRLLVFERYHHGLTSEECARKHGLSEPGLRVTLYRLRGTLRKCIERAMRLDQRI